MIAINISGIHYHVSERTREYINEKLGHLDRYHPRLHSLHLTLHGAEKDGFRADAVMHLHSGKEVVAHHVEQSPFAAIDGVYAKCATQLRKIHERERERHPSRAAIVA